MVLIVVACTSGLELTKSCSRGIRSAAMATGLKLDSTNGTQKAIMIGKKPKDHSRRRRR